MKLEFEAVETNKPWLWLLLGALATCLGHLRWGVDLLAWLAPIAWLRYLSLSEGWRSRAAFVAVFVLAWNLLVVGIITAPLSLAMAPMFGVPIGLLLVWPYLVWARHLRHSGHTGGRSEWSTLLFPATMAVAETLAHTLTPFGVWGHMANAALDDLPLLQLASLTGAVGVGFVLHWLAAALEARFAGGGLRQLALACAAFVAAHVFGAVRLDLASSTATPTVTVASVGTDCDAGGWPLPDVDQRLLWDQTLFERTRAAARAGAELVVWNEAASVVDAEHEATWLDAVGGLARDESVALVAAYIVPFEEGEHRYYENAYAMFDGEGTLVHRYLKHHPVPGEPAVPGTGPAPVWSSEELGEVSGAICYDYDFPRAARERAGVDLVALPSSDWRGIDPIHTQMAQLRAIEAGHSIMRSTRFGLSAGIDSLGVMRGRLSHFDDPQRVLLVELPKAGRTTLYAQLGEWFALVCACLALLAWFGGRRKPA